MGDRRGVYRLLVGKQRDHLGDPGLDGRIILRWIVREWVVGHVLDRSGSGWGQVADTCECGDEPMGSIRCGEFLDYLRTG